MNQIRGCSRLDMRTQAHGEFEVGLDIPFFVGHLHVENCLDWEQAVESFFE